MAKRREFPRSIKVAVIQRATRGGSVYCEQCSGLAKRFQIDHIIADAIGGEPVISNAQLLCQACFEVKNPIDTKLAAKTKRRQDKHLGARPAPVRPMQSAPFPVSERAAKREPKAALPPRSMFEEV